tara:strand:+ start:8921 stop:9574 length:654 start_codon:yes stop_codon:yes gene_type:complete
MIKLCYFNVRGLAETSRLLFAIGEEEYQDFRYPLEVINMKTYEMKKDEFEKDKQEGKLIHSLNKLPFIEVDNVIIPQSKAIERFLAERFNLMGNNPIEKARIDSICECVRDFKELYQKVRKLPEEEKSNGMNQWFTITLVELLKNIENLLDEDGYSVGSVMSLSDVVLYSFIKEFFDNKEASYNATLASPKLRLIIDRVASDERVKRWNELRPETIF